MNNKITNILLPPSDVVKSELSTQVLGEDEQAMVCEPVRVCVEQSLQGETVPDRRCEQSPYGRWNGQISDLTGGDNAVKSELSVTLFNKNKQSIKKLCAFTLAEILLSLSIIGIVATIVLPSLLGNVHTDYAFKC